MNGPVYVTGSLRNPRVPELSAYLRANDIDVFDDWYAAGPIADDSWRDYELARGHDYVEALRGYAAEHIYNFDRHHLNRAAAGVLLTPAGKSCHLELGYLAGQQKPTFILLDRDYDRWDVMYRFATSVVWTPDELCREIHTHLR